MMKTMTFSQILVFWILTFTTLVGGLMWLGFIRLVDDLDQSDPIVGK